MSGTVDSDSCGKTGSKIENITKKKLFQSKIEFLPERLKLFVFIITLGFFVFTLLFFSKNAPDSFFPQSYQALSDLESQGLYRKDSSWGRAFRGQGIALDFFFRGKVVIVSFWATWCEPCVEEFPSFIELLETYPKKIILLAISWDENRKDVNQFISAFDGFRPQIKVYLDREKKISQAFAVDRLPEGFIFNSQGELVKKIVGVQNWSSPMPWNFSRTYSVPRPARFILPQGLQISSCS